MESRIRLILVMLIMIETILNVDSSAHSENPKGLRLEQWHNKNIYLQRPDWWIGVVSVPATVQPDGREAGVEKA